MKKLLFALSAVAIVLISCGKDDEPTPKTETPSYSFKNQNLQGQVEGQSWSFIEGQVQEDAFTPGKFVFVLKKAVDPDACVRYTNPKEDFILYATTDLKVGLVEMSFTQNATLVDSPALNNIVATDGAIEILSIDTVAGIVTGRMDIRSDNTNFANGNFSVNICPE